MSKFLEYGRKYLDELEITTRVEGLLYLCDAIVILTHREAIDYTHEHKIYKDDIPEMQERQVIDDIGNTVFLVRYPKSFKSFYFATFDEDTVLGCDVEVPGTGEIIASKVRLHDNEGLKKNAIMENGLKQKIIANI